MIPLIYNVRSLTVRKTTTAATLIGVGLVVFVFAAVFMLNADIKKTLGQTGRADTAIVLRFGSDAELSSGMDEAQVNVMRSNDKVAKDASGNGLVVGEVVVVVTLDKLGTDHGIANVQVRGVPADVYAFRPETKMVAGRKATPNTDEVVIGKNLRGRFPGVDLGGQFELKKNRPVKVVGIFEDGGSTFESEIWGDLDTIRQTFGREGIVSSMRVRLASASKLEAFRTDVQGDKKLGLQVERETTYYENQSSGMTLLLTILGAVIAFFFALGAIIGAAITMYAAVAHRNKEIGTLRALGFSRTSILISFLFESMLLAALGGALGCAASLAMGLVHFSMMNPATWSELVFNFEATPQILLYGMIFSIVMGLVGGFLPAWRASRLSPIEAMRA